MLLFGATAFSWKSFSKTLPDMPDLQIDTQVSDCVVVFVHAEEEDVDKPKLETKMLKNIKWLANKFSYKQVVLHSFTHLSESTAPPEFAQALLNTLSERLSTTDYQVSQTPFGYFCSWDISVRGESLGKVFKSL